VQLAYSTNAFTRTDLASAVNAIADIGFSGVEILCDHPHWFPGRVGHQELDRIAEIVARRGLAISNLNANTANGYYHPAPPENVFEPALSNADPALRRWRQDYSIEALRIAHRIGANAVSVTAGHPRPGVSPSRALDYFVESLMRICEAAERLGVRVGIEYEPGLLVERAVELKEVLERVGSPRLGANLDIGHSYLDGESPEAAIGLLAGRIWNVHVEDIKARKHFHLVPGDGDLPFRRYLDALRANGYDGFLTVELYTYPEAPVEVGRRSFEYLERLVPPVPAPGPLRA
jgi:sugar phosphate isomerase/epimerase